MILVKNMFVTICGRIFLSADFQRIFIFAFVAQQLLYVLGINMATKWINQHLKLIGVALLAYCIVAYKLDE